MRSSQSKRGDNGGDVPKNGGVNGNNGGGIIKKQDASTPGRSTPPVVPGSSVGTPPAGGGGGTSTVVADGGGTVRTRTSGGNDGGGGTPFAGPETPPSSSPTPANTQGTSITTSPTSLRTSVTGESNYKSTSGVSSSTSQSMVSIRYTTDPSGNTQIVTIGVEPSGISSTASRSGTNAGVIAGVIILILFIFSIVGFLLYRRRVRRRNRIAPSAQHLADYGPRPLSWGRTFFKRRGSSQYYDISRGNMTHTWQGPNFQSGHGHVGVRHEGQSQSGHMTGPEMRESESQTGHTNVSTQSTSGKTSIGAAVGHSPVPHDNPFADAPEIRISTISGH